MIKNYKKGDIIYTRDSGAKIILDSVEGEGLNQMIYAHIVDDNGKAYPPKLLDNLLSHGYWEVASKTFNSSKKQKLSEKLDTVTPKFSIQDDED